MSGSTESQIIDRALNVIFNIKCYPKSLVVKEGYCATILLSEYYCSQKEYIPIEVFDMVKLFFANNRIEIFSLDAYLNGRCYFENVFSGAMDLLNVDRVCDEMQCYSFILFLTEKDFIIGLDEEVVIFVSKKIDGFISKMGGVSYFYQFFNKQIEYISTPLDSDIIKNLSTIFYKSDEKISRNNIC